MAGYDLFVLQSMAKHVLAFESMCGDADWFSTEVALEIAELSKGKIDQIKNKYNRSSRKERNKKVCLGLNS